MTEKKPTAREVFGPKPDADRLRRDMGSSVPKKKIEWQRSKAPMTEREKRSSVINRLLHRRDVLVAENIEELNNKIVGLMVMESLEMWEMHVMGNVASELVMYADGRIALPVDWPEAFVALVNRLKNAK